MKRIGLLVSALFLSVITSFAEDYQETLYLKNESAIKGVDIEQTPDTFLKIQTSDGNESVYEMCDVEEVMISSMASKRKGKEKPIQVGSRGFLEVGYTLGFTLGDRDLNRMGFSISHGYQVLPCLYVGAGLGVNFFDYWKKLIVANIPVFADFRVNILNEPVLPFINLKIGYSIDKISGFYCTPSIGTRIAIAEGCGVNVGLGYEIQLVKGITLVNLEPKYKYENWGGLTLKVGFDF